MGGQIAFAGLSLFHTSKWAIEGFFEAFAQEVAPRHRITLVETVRALEAQKQTAFSTDFAA